MVKERPAGQIGRGFRIGKLGLALTGSYLGYQFQNLFLNEQERPGEAEVLQPESGGPRFGRNSNPSRGR
jgi:hypothetical protein